MTDDFKVQLPLIVSAGERTRAILYFLGLIFAVLAAVICDFELFNWTNQRQQMITKAFACYTQNRSPKDTINELLPPFKEFPPPGPCSDAYSYVEHNYGILLPPVNTEIKWDYPRSWEAITDRYKALSQAYVDNAYTTIPIISIKIEKNNIFVYGLLIQMMALMTLKLSIQHLSKCIRDITPLISNINEVNAVVNCCVFSKPRTRSHKFWWFLFVPMFLAWWEVYVNVDQLSTIRAMVGGAVSMAGEFYFGQIVFTVLLSILSWLCFASARSLDDQLVSVNSMYPVNSMRPPDE